MTNHVTPGRPLRRALSLLPHPIDVLALRQCNKGYKDAIDCWGDGATITSAIQYGILNHQLPTQDNDFWLEIHRKLMLGENPSEVDLFYARERLRTLDAKALPMTEKEKLAAFQKFAEAGVVPVGGVVEVFGDKPFNLFPPIPEVSQHQKRLLLIEEMEL